MMIPMRLGPGWKTFALGTMMGCIAPIAYAHCDFSKVRQLMGFSPSPYVSNPNRTTSPSVVSYLIRYGSPHDPQTETHHVTLNLADPRFDDLLSAAKNITYHRRAEDLSDEDIFAVANLVIESMNILDPQDPVKATPSSRLLSFKAMGGEIDFSDRIPITHASLTLSSVANDIQRSLVLAEVYMALGLTVRLRNLGPDLPVTTEASPSSSHHGLPQDLFLEIYVEHRDILKRLSLIPGIQKLKHWPGVHTLRRLLAGVYWRLDPYSLTLTRAGFTQQGTRVIGGTRNDRLERAQLTNRLARAVHHPVGFFGTENQNFVYARRVDHPEDAFLEYVNRMQIKQIFDATRKAREGETGPLDQLLVSYLSQSPFEIYLQQNLHRRALALNFQRPFSATFPEEETELFRMLEQWVATDAERYFLPLARSKEIQKLIAQWVNQRRRLSKLATVSPAAMIMGSENAAFYALSKAFYQARKQALHTAAFELPPAHARILIERLVYILTHTGEFELSSYSDTLIPHARLLVSAFVRMHQTELEATQALIHATTPFHIGRLTTQTQTHLILINQADIDPWLAMGSLFMERQDPSGVPTFLSTGDVDLTYLGMVSQPGAPPLYLYAH